MSEIVRGMLVFLLSLWCLTEGCTGGNLTTSKEHLDKGDALRSRWLLKEAQIEYKEAIRIKSNYAEAYNNLGLTFCEQNNVQDAIIEFRKAIQSNKDLPESHFNLGSAYAVQGICGNQEKYFVAEKEFRTAIQLKPNYSEAYNNLGNILYLQGKFVESEIQYREAIKYRPIFPPAYDNLSIALWKQERLEIAFKEMHEAVRTKRTDSWGHFNFLVPISWKDGKLPEEVRSYWEDSCGTNLSKMYKNVPKDIMVSMIEPRWSFPWRNRPTQPPR